MAKLSIKKTLQSAEWDRFLRAEAKLGNEDTKVILDYMKKNRWMRSQRSSPNDHPNLKLYKPQTEV